jgi:murein DD-endopeptidase MepM/ murein hydrolase activator NlpD
MTDSGSDGPSFDPRRWGAAKPDASKLAAGDPTFDPKSWSQPRAPAPRPKPPSGGWVLAGALVVVVIAVGGVGYFTWRRSQPAHSVRVVTIRTVVAPVVPGAQRRSLTLTGPQELLGALTSAGAAEIDAEAATQAAQVQLGGGSGELRVTLTLLPAGSGVVLSRVEARHDNGTGAIVSRQPDGRYMATSAGADLVTQVKVVRGQMDVNSFYSSAVAAGVNDDLIPGFAQAFAYDFDFQREIKPGDVFEAVFEQQADPSGDAVGAGKLLFASLETQAKSKALYWYAPPSKPGGWFDANGHSVIRSLMRTPVEGARISSPFGVRMHPVLGFMKMHNGTDFAAPVGTPIYAAGDGVVEFSGMKGPNGNFTKILHPNGWETLYLHQSFIEPNVVAGAHVSQSQEIGLVGATGVDSAGHSTVTGPHLHYEVHINNTPVDPMSIAVGEGQALGGADMSGFIQERNRIDALRASQGG